MSSTTHNSLSQTVVSWCLTFAVLTAPASRNQGPGNLGEAGGQGGQKTWFSSTGAKVSGRLTLGRSLPSSRVPCESMDFAPSWERTQASSQASYRKCVRMKQQCRGWGVVLGATSQPSVGQRPVSNTARDARSETVLRADQPGTRRTQRQTQCPQEVC